MQGGELCTVSGVRLGTGYGLILGGLCNVLYNSGGVIAGVEMLGTGLAYGAMVGWLGNLFIGLPMFFVAAFFAPPREGRAVRPGYLLWELRQVFGRYQTIGSVTFALAGCFIGVALKILLGSGSDQTLVELLLLAGAALGATVGVWLALCTPSTDPMPFSARR